MRNGPAIPHHVGSDEQGREFTNTVSGGCTAGLAVL